MKSEGCGGRKDKECGSGSSRSAEVWQRRSTSVFIMSQCWAINGKVRSRSKLFNSVGASVNDFVFHLTRCFVQL